MADGDLPRPLCQAVHTYPAAADLVPRFPLTSLEGPVVSGDPGCLGATCSQCPLGMDGALSLPLSWGEARAASCIAELPVGPGGDQTP